MTFKRCFAGFIFLLIPGALCQAQLIPSAPMGISTLHCLEPAARASCDSIVDTVYRSGVSQPALTFLVDGSFGSDLDYAFNAVSKLTEGDRKLHLMLYLSNGPRQRDCRRQVGKPGYAVSVCQKTFNEAIFTDWVLQKWFQDIAYSMLPLVEFAQSRGAVVYINLQLEDNLTTRSFEFMLKLVEGVFPDSVRFVRNRHLRSNDPIKEGVLLEKHFSNHRQVRGLFGGFVINDGDSTRLPGVRSSYDKNISFTATRRLRDASARNGNVFLLWNAQLQGLKGGRKQPTHLRKYLVLSPRLQSTLIAFLRGH